MSWFQNNSSGLLASVANGVFGLIGQGKQNRENRKLAKWEMRENRKNADTAFAREKELLNFQLDYNTPYNQMARFKEAGLNPALVYGQGSPGNMQSAPSVPVAAPARRADYSFALPMIGTMLQDARLKEAQADLLNEKTDESQIKQDLMRVQTAVQNANPYLKDGYVDSIVAQMKAVADMKKQEAGFKLEEVTGPFGDSWYMKGTPRGYIMMSQQMEQLFQKFNLSQADLKLKAEVLQSKEFQNALQEIQVQWMKAGEITPQHIFQGIMMLLQKMM